MAEVGVLELTIKDNSAKATSGLKGLAGALDIVRQSAGNSLGLGAVNAQLKEFATTVSRQKNTSVVIKNVTEFGKAVSKLSTIKNAINFNVKPIADLKKAIGDGIKITGNPAGQLERIREAIGGEWGSDDAIKAMRNLKYVAEGFEKSGSAATFSSMAKSIKAFKEAISGGKANPSGLEAVGTTIQNATADVDKGVAEYNKVIDKYDKVEQQFKRSKLMKLNLGQFGEKGEVENLDAAARESFEISEGMEKVSESIEHSVAGMSDLEQQARLVKNETDQFTGVKEFTENLADSTQEVQKAAENSAAVLDSSKMDNVNPFENASDEIAHYSELLAKAKSDLSFWENQWEKTSKATKYNGPSEERTNMLSHAEEGFEAAYKQIEEYENKLEEIRGRVTPVASEWQHVEESLEGTDTQISDIADKMEKVGEKTEEAKEEYRKYCEEVRAQQEAKFYGTDQRKNKSYSIMDSNAMADNIREIDALKAELRDAEVKFNKLLNKFGEADSRTLKAGLAVSKLRDKIWEYNNAIDDGKGYEEEGQFFDPEVVDEQRSMLDLLQEKYEIVKEKFSEDLEAGKLNKEGVNNYKTQLARLEDRIDKLKDKYAALDADGGMRTMADDAIKAADAFLETNNNLDLLKQKIDAMKVKLGEGVIGGTLNEEQLSKLGTQIINAQEKYDKLARTMEESKESNGMDIIAEDARRAADEFLNANDNLELMKQQIDALKTKLGTGLMDGTLNEEQAARLGQQIENLQSKYNKLADAEKNASSMSGRIRSAFSSFKESVKSMFPHLENLARQFKRIAVRMALRGVIKQVTSAFKEGVENVYHYSDAIGTDFADKMDSAASSLQQMRNSIGAAVAPVIQALIPILQTVVSWFITAINYINQFFALLSGQTQWTRALETATTAYEKSAKKASKAKSDWLADFDELNVMSNGSGSGTTGKSDTDYSKMFEEVTEFDSKVKDVVKWIEDHMDTVLGIAGAIGVAILGWKLSKAFDGVIGTLGEIVAGGAIGLIGLKLAYEGAYDAGFQGEFDTKTLIETIGGVVAAATGGAIIGYGIAGPTGALMGVVVGLTLGIGTTFLAYQRGTANAAAKIAFAKSGEGGIDPDKYLEALQSELEKRTSGAKLILDAYIDVPDLKQKLDDAASEISMFNQKIFNGDGKLSEEDAKAFKENWTMVMDTLDQMETKTYDTLLSGVISAIGSDNEQLRAKAEETRVLMISLRDNVSEAKAAWIKETEDLADKIASGKYEEKDVTEYKRRLSLIAAEENGTTYTDAVDAVAKKSDRINFGDKDTALENANNFLTELKTSYEESIDLIGEARDAATEAYKYQKMFYNELLESGKLKPEEYNGLMDALNLEYEVNIDFLNDNENEIKKKVEEAYNKVFSQVAEAYKSLDSNDKKKEYWNSVVEPLVEAARKDGYSIPKELMDANPDRVIASSMETMAKENASNVEKLVYEAADAVTNFLFGDDMMDTAIGMMRDGSIFNAINFLGWHRLFGNSEEERPLESTEDTKKYMAKYGMQDTLQALVNQYMAEHNVSQLSGMENSSKMFAYLFSSLEQTSTQGGVESLKESDISDIVNSLLLILPEYESGLLLNWLDEQREAFGDTFDFEKVVKLIDWKALSNRTGEEYDAEEFAKEVNSWIDTYNSKNTNGMQIEHITPDQLFVNPNGAGGTGGEADTEAAVESGVKKGFSGQMDNTDRILRDILTTVRQKRFVITPNTAIGRATSASMGMYGNVTGDDPHYIP